MEDIQPPKPPHGSVSQHTSRQRHHHHVGPPLAHRQGASPKTLKLTLHIPQLHFEFLKPMRMWLGVGKHRYVAGAVALLVLAASIIPILQEHLTTRSYNLSPQEASLLSPTSQALADKLQYDAKNGVYNFNANYSPADPNTDKSFGGPQVSAKVYQDPKQGVTVTDPINQVDFTMKPKFEVLPAKQQSNRLVSPTYLGGGHLVYTAQADGLKEDITLQHYAGSTLNFKYELDIGDALAAKLLSDGSVGVYGSSLPINGTVSTGSAKDAALLQKARQNAVKDKLLFTIPAPVIHQRNRSQSMATAKFNLDNNSLNVVVTNLKKANYPLTIDPSVTVTSVTDFFRDANNEANTDFDSSNNQVLRGAVTGGNVAAWAATSGSMTQSRFLAGTAIYNGYAYVVGGAIAATTSNYTGTNYVEYGTLTAGSPSSLTWQTGVSTGLPAGGLSRFKLVAYNGYLYAIDGSTTDTSCTTLNSSVYYATIQVNGVLSSWNSLSGPATARCSFGATAYNGYLYVAGGKTGAANSTGTTNVSYAQILPNGTLGTWTTTTALTSATYGGDLQGYNGYLYFVGGNQNATLTTSVFYAAIATNGSVYSSAWTTTNSFTTARENFGSNFVTINNGYIYLSGGCSSVNASQTCAAAGNMLSDTQLAQINADGSLGIWFANGGNPALSRIGANLQDWVGTLYSIAGCSVMSTSTISCTTALATQQYGTVSTPGQASNLKTSGNNLPVGLFGSAVVVNNGFIYSIGGCTQATCSGGGGIFGTSDTSNATYFATINSDGTIGSWTTDTHTLNGTGSTNGEAEMATVVANNILYGFGGYNDGGASNVIWTVSLNSNGTLAANWAQNGTALNTAAYAMSALYYNGSVYTFGGCIGSGGSNFGCSTYVSTATHNVVSYTINGTTIGAASSTGLSQIANGTLNVPNAAMGMAFYDGYVYLCGGANSNAAANGGPQTQYCIYNGLTSAGTTGSWTLTTGTLNQTIRRGSAYAANGYLYVYSGHNAQTGNSVGDINIGKINPATGDIASFSLSPTAFTPKWDASSAFVDGNIYSVGGCTNGAPPVSCTTGGLSKLTEYFGIYNATNAGTRAITNSGNSLGTALAGNSSAVYNGYLYVAGGCSAYTVSTTTCTTAVGSSSFAALNPDGSVGSWTAGPSFPSSALRGFGCMVALNGTLYFMGGATSGGTAQSDVYFSTASGASWNSGSWAAVNGGSATGKLLAAKSGLGCATYNNRIYATGGSASTTVYFSPSLPNGGDITSAWTSTTAFTTNRSYHVSVAAGGYLYVLGGFDGTNFLSSVQYGLINSDGTISSWGAGIDLPNKMRQMGAFAANGYIYVLAGATGTASTSCLSSVFVASISNDGSTGSWSQGVATSFTAISAPAVAYYNGYYYLAGGNNCTSNVTTVSYAGEQSQAIRAVYSRYIDLVGNATPEKFVANGTNAALSSVDIEKWRLRYMASTTANNSWGVQSSINPITFGANPMSISALDGSSVNQGVSEWFFLLFDIDQSQTFTFTDNTQPTITDYNFYYAPGPGQRLRNGKIFQDQIQQSLDAHP